MNPIAGHGTPIATLPAAERVCEGSFQTPLRLPLVNLLAFHALNATYVRAMKRVIILQFKHLIVCQI